MLRARTFLAFAAMIFGCTPRSCASSEIAPVEKNGHFVFSSGNIALEIDPRVGGRVVAFSLEGRNFLTGTEADPNNYGSTFWTSPQSDWGWPPPPEIDNLPYSSAILGKKLVLTSATNQKMGLSVTKTFSFDATTSSVTIEYAVTNHASAPR